jgi:Histidine phosphatase superfamily (branch 1)
MRILIIRHADPEYRGDTLTEHGWKEAEVLAKYLGSLNEEGKGKITKIYTSPMGRARDTAKCTEATTGLKAEVQEWTRELTYWSRLELEWNGKADAGAGPGKGGEGGLAVWDIPGEVVRAIPEVTTLNEFELIPPIAKTKGPYAELCANSDAFLSGLGYSRQEDGTYKILKRNRDVRMPAVSSLPSCVILPWVRLILKLRFGIAFVLPPLCTDNCGVLPWRLWTYLACTTLGHAGLASMV